MPEKLPRLPREWIGHFTGSDELRMLKALRNEGKYIPWRLMEVSRKIGVLPTGLLVVCR